MMPFRRLVALTPLLAVTLACGESVEGPSGTADSIPPVITALEPSPNARDVPETVVITVRFSEPINPATVGPGSFLLRQGFDTVAGSYAFGDSSMSFIPDGALPFVTAFSVTVTRGIRDPAGNQLAGDTAWGFLTVGQGTPAPRR
jgi:hypothetical protein